MKSANYHIGFLSLFQIDAQAVSSIKDDTSFTKLRQVGEVNMSVTELRETFNKKKKTKNVEKLDKKKNPSTKECSVNCTLKKMI